MFADARTDPEAAEARLLARLDALGIGYTRHAHPPLRTVEESRALRGAMPGAHCKNLFLREKKGGLWLAVCEEARAIRIRDLEKSVGAKNVSFGSAERLGEALGVLPGAVTPLSLVNDAARQVRLILDAQMMQAEVLNCHPLHNEATVAVRTDDLRRLFADSGHAPLEVDFDALEAAAACEAGRSA